MGIIPNPILNSKNLQEALISRFVDNNLTMKEVAEYCKRQGRKIPYNNLRNIMNGNIQISNNEFMWLLDQFGVKIIVKHQKLRKYEYQKFRDKYLRRKDAVPLMGK